MVDLGKLEALLPLGERVPGERYEHGTRIKCLVVLGRARACAARRSRCRASHPNLVKKLFALEVPEIADGTVEIAAIAREAGHRTKIAVQLDRARRQRQGRLHRPDGPAGAQRDDRAARREDRHRRLVRRPGRASSRHALSPARVTCGRGRRRRGRASARVIVPDFQLSLAIGKEGQNARLAARLTGWRIDIRSDEAPAEPPIAPELRRRRPGLRRPGRRPSSGTRWSSSPVRPRREVEDGDHQLQRVRRRARAAADLRAVDA